MNHASRRCTVSMLSLFSGAGSKVFVCLRTGWEELKMNKKALLLAATCAAFGIFGGTSAFAQTKLGVDVISSRPDMVSGGSALVKITGADAAPTVTVDGKDVSAAFKADPKGGWIGLVE